MINGKVSSVSVSGMLKKIHDDQIRDTLEVFEYFVCQKHIDNLKEFVNIYAYKNTKTKYMISSIVQNNLLLIFDKKAKIRMLDLYSKEYYNIIRTMILDFDRDGKLSEQRFLSFSKIKNELNTFFNQLIIDIESYEKKYDNLTNILNRKYFLEAVNHSFSGGNYILVMADIDNFRNVNSLYGHPVGDMVIKEIAALFRENLRSDDLVARYGGEEFIFALGGNTDSSVHVIERLRAKVEEMSIFIEDSNSELKITCSFGAVDNRTNIQVPHLIKKADKALYMSKNNGKNQVTLFPQSS